MPVIYFWQLLQDPFTSTRYYNILLTVGGEFFESDFGPKRGITFQIKKKIAFLGDHIKNALKSPKKMTKIP